MPLSASSSEPPLAQLPGLSQANLEQLQALGLHTPAQLLAACTTPAARQDLAGQLQIQEQQVRKWAALADLARLPSVGCDYCGLLLHAGVASSAQLLTAKCPICSGKSSSSRLQPYDGVTSARRSVRFSSGLQRPKD